MRIRSLETLCDWYQVIQLSYLSLDLDFIRFYDLYVGLCNGLEVEKGC